MKSLFLFVLCLSLKTFACADLSRIEKRPPMGGEIYVRQTNCGEWSNQIYFEGKPAGEPAVQKLGPDWNKTETDDAYEKFTSEQKWAWTPDATKVLHELTIDTLDKTTKDETFQVQSSYFALEGDFVTEKGMGFTRTLHPNGEIEYTSRKIDNRFPRLP